MPTVLRIGPYRFYFYGHEPERTAHVHVDRDDQSAKFWLEPIGLARKLGFSPPELRKIERPYRNINTNCWRPGMTGSGICRVNASKTCTSAKTRSASISWTAERLRFRTSGIPVCYMPRLCNVRTGGSAALVTGFTGRISTGFEYGRAITRALAPRARQLQPSG